MDRGVIVGGGLIAASFLVAVLLNRSAHQESVPAATLPPPPPLRACEDPAQRTPPAAETREAEKEKCRQLTGDSAQQ
jgi:hypothetical protein